MTTFDVRRFVARARSVGGALVVVTGTALVLFCMPRQLTAPAKTALREAQRPGQIAAQACRHWTTDAVGHMSIARVESDELAVRHAEIDRLQRQNRQLQTALAIELARGDRA